MNREQASTLAIISTALVLLIAVLAVGSTRNRELPAPTPTTVATTSTTTSTTLLGVACQGPGFTYRTDIARCPTPVKEKP